MGAGRIALVQMGAGRIAWVQMGAGGIGWVQMSGGETGWVQMGADECIHVVQSGGLRRKRPRNESELILEWL